MAKLASKLRDGTLRLVAVVRDGVKRLAAGCTCCSETNVRGYYIATPCAFGVEQFPNPDQAPCTRPPYAVVYVRSDVIFGGAETARQLVARMVAAADAAGQNAEIGFSWAGYCYTLGLQEFDLPGGVTPVIDSDPYTSDVITPPATVSVFEAQTIPRNEAGRYCLTCRSGIRYCAVYPCTRQAGAPTTLRHWICANAVGQAGNVIRLGTVCLCIACGEQADYSDIPANERARIIDIANVSIWQNCNQCVANGNDPPGLVREFCADGTECAYIPPCECTFGGSATVTDIQVDSNDARFSYYQSRAFRLLASGILEEQSSFWAGTSTPNGPPTDFSDWQQVGNLAGQDRVPVCDGRWCVRIPADPPPAFPFDINQGPVGVAIPGADHYRGLQPGGDDNFGTWYGSAQCQVNCFQGSYGWTSRSRGRGPGVTRDGVSQGLLIINCQCAPLPDVSTCDRPYLTVPGIPSNATPSIDPEDDLP